MTSPATYRLNPFVASLFGGRGVASNPSNPESIFTASDDTPQKKTQAALDKLEKAVADIQSGDNFREWLKVAGRFHKYSIGNQMLIWLQRPKSSRVAGFNTWKQLGRFVKSGEKGIAILVPAGVGRRITAQSELESFTARRTKKYIDSGMDGEEAKQKAENDAAEARSFKQTFRFITGYVFDIDQTTGRPLPEFDVPELKGDDSKVLFDKLVLYAQRRRNIPVIFDPKRDPQNGTQGYYSPTENIIWIKADSSINQQCKTLIHELGHERLHKPHQFDYASNRGEAETQAEAIAYAVGQHYGYDTGARSFPYIAGWAAKPDTLKKALGDLRKHIEEMIEDIGEFTRAQEKQEDARTVATNGAVPAAANPKTSASDRDRHIRETIRFQKALLNSRNSPKKLRALGFDSQAKADRALAMMGNGATKNDVLYTLGSNNPAEVRKCPFLIAGYKVGSTEDKECGRRVAKGKTYCAKHWKNEPPPKSSGIFRSSFGRKSNPATDSCPHCGGNIGDLAPGDYRHNPCGAHIRVK